MGKGGGPCCSEEEKKVAHKEDTNGDTKTDTTSTTTDNKADSTTSTTSTTTDNKAEKDKIVENPAKVTDKDEKPVAEDKKSVKDKKTPATGDKNSAEEDKKPEDDQKKLVEEEKEPEETPTSYRPSRPSPDNFTVKTDVRKGKPAAAVFELTALSLHITQTSVEDKNVYLKLLLIDGIHSTPVTTVKTKPQRGKEISFEEEFPSQSWCLSNGSVLCGKSLLVQLWSDNLLIDDLLGEAWVPLGLEGVGNVCQGATGVKDGARSSVTVTLLPRIIDIKELKETVSCGDVSFTLFMQSPQWMKHNRPPPKLSISNITGGELKKMDMVGKADPYVVFQVERKGEEKAEVLYEARTTIIKNTLDPDFEDEFNIDLSSDDKLSECILSAAIYDWNKLAQDKPMGYLSVAFSDLTKGVKTQIKRDVGSRPDKTDKVAGWLSFNINYDQKEPVGDPEGVNHKYEVDKEHSHMNPALPYLAVSDISIHEVAAADIGGSSDPYVRISLMDGDRICHIVKTSVKNKTLSCEWPDEFFSDWNLTPGSSLYGKRLHVQVWDHDMGPCFDDFLGEGWVTLGETVEDGKLNDIQFTLQGRPRDAKNSKKKRDAHVKGHCKLRIALESPQWIAENRPPPTFSIKRIQGESLEDTDTFSQSDPFVRLSLMSTKVHFGVDFRYQTAVVKDELNPQWNELDYSTWRIPPGERLHGRTLILSCWDDDLLQNDFLGQLSIRFKGGSVCDGEPQPNYPAHQPGAVETILTSEGKERWIESDFTQRPNRTDRVKGKARLFLHYEEHRWTNNGIRRQFRDPGLFDVIDGVYHYEDDPSVVGTMREGKWVCEQARQDWTLQHRQTKWEERLICQDKTTNISGHFKSELLGGDLGGHMFDHSQPGLLDLGDNRTRINDIAIYHTANAVHGFTLQYNNNERVEVGEQIATATKTTFELDEDEYLYKIIVRAHETLESIEMFTNKGKSTTALGYVHSNSPPHEFVFANNEIIGFHGSYTGGSVDSFGVVFCLADPKLTVPEGTRFGELKLVKSIAVGREYDGARLFNGIKTGCFCPPPSQGEELPKLLPGMTPATINKITVFFGSFVKGFVVEYNNGQKHVCGSEEGNSKEIMMQQGEYVNAIHVRGKNFVEAVRFITTSGRRTAFYGGTGKMAKNSINGSVNNVINKLQAPAGFEIIGFHGTFSGGTGEGDNTRVDSVGVIYRTVETTRMNYNSSNKTEAKEEEEEGEHFLVFRVEDGTCNMLSLQNSELYNGNWIRSNTNGLEVEGAYFDTLPASDVYDIPFPEEVQKPAVADRINPWKEGRTWGVVRTSEWQVHQSRFVHTVKRQASNKPHNWKVWLQIPDNTVRTKDCRVSLTIDGESVKPEQYQTYDKCRLGEKILVHPISDMDKEEVVVEAVYQWHQCKTQLVCISDPSEALKDNVNSKAKYFMQLSRQDTKRYTMEDHIYSYNNEEFKDFVATHIFDDHALLSEVDVARRALKYLSENVLLDATTDDNEIMRMGPYFGLNVKGFPMLLKLLRTGTASTLEHSIMFVGIMRAAGVPARICRMQSNYHEYPNVSYAEFFVRNATWVAVQTTDKSRNLESFATDPPLPVMDYGLGTVVDCKMSKSEEARLVRCDCDPIYFTHVDTGYTVEEGKEALTAEPIADFSIEPTSFASDQPSGWFPKFSGLSTEDTRLMCPLAPIHVPAPPKGAIDEDNQRLKREFQGFDFKALALQFLEHIGAKEMEQAAERLAVSRLVEVEVAKDGFSGWFKEELEIANLQHLAEKWPDECEVEILGVEKEDIISNIGNDGKIITVGVKLNGMRLLCNLEFVHSRGDKIFDFEILFPSSQPRMTRQKTDRRVK